MGHHGHAPKELQNPGPLKIGSSFKTMMIVFAVIGIGAFIAGLNVDAHRAWPNFLINFYYFLGFAAMGVLFVAIQHITNSYWSVTVRRIAEGYMQYLPVALLLGVVLFFGKNHPKRRLF